jgi:hypothetical protein
MWCSGGRGARPLNSTVPDATRGRPSAPTSGLPARPRTSALPAALASTCRCRSRRMRTVVACHPTLGFCSHPAARASRRRGAPWREMPANPRWAGSNQRPPACKELRWVRGGARLALQRRCARPGEPAARPPLEDWARSGHERDLEAELLGAMHLRRLLPTVRGRRSALPARFSPRCATSSAWPCRARVSVACTWRTLIRRAGAAGIAAYAVSWCSEPRCSWSASR